MRKNSFKHKSPAGALPFSPLACSAALRLLVTAGVSLLLWLVVFWAMRP